MAGLTTNEHGADGEDLLRVRVGGHIAEAHAGEAAEREVEGGDVSAAQRRAAQEFQPRPVGLAATVVTLAGAVPHSCALAHQVVGRLQSAGQLLQPAWGGGRSPESAGQHCHTRCWCACGYPGVGGMWIQVYPQGFPPLSSSAHPALPSPPQPSARHEKKAEAAISPARVLSADDGARSTVPFSQQLALIPEIPDSVLGATWMRPPSLLCPPDSSCSFFELTCSRKLPPIRAPPSHTRDQPHTHVLKDSDVAVHITPSRLHTRSTLTKTRTHMCKHIHRCTAMVTHTEKACVHSGARKGYTGACTRTHVHGHKHTGHR